MSGRRTAPISVEEQAWNDALDHAEYLAEQAWKMFPIGTAKQACDETVRLIRLSKRPAASISPKVTVKPLGEGQRAVFWTLPYFGA
jgi:hypothetical protein